MTAGHGEWVFPYLAACPAAEYTPRLGRPRAAEGTRSRGNDNISAEERKQ